MKPIIIYQEIKDNKITMTKEEFESIIQKIYEDGIKEGKNLIFTQPYYNPDTWTWTQPSKPYTNTPYTPSKPYANTPYKPLPIVYTSKGTLYTNNKTIINDSTTGR